MKKHAQAATLSLWFSLFAAVSAPAAEKTDIRFATDWVFHGGYSAYFVALEKGLYRERGLKVNVERGYGASDGVKRLGAGTNDLVFGDSGAAILARSAGAKVKLMAVIYEKAPFGIYALKKSGISAPKHLEGRTIATGPGDANHTLFPALARAAGIDAGKVKWVKVDPTQQIPLLLAGKADATTLFVTSGHILDRETPKLGGHNRILYSDYGVDIYSNGITTTDKFLAENPGSVRAFVQGTVRAYETAFAEPDEAIRILLKHQPHLNRDLSRTMLDIVKGIVLTPAARANGIGRIAEDKMRRTRDTILSAHGKKVEVPLQDIYTNKALR